MKHSPVRRSCAFFDVDGTLLKGFIIQSFPRFLANKGFIEADYPNRIDKIISDYDAGNIPYRETAEIIPSFYALALKGKRASDVKMWAEKFMETYLPEHIFSYSKELVHQVSNLVDVTIAISGSPLEVVEELELGFDRIYGSVFEKKFGNYTGRVVANLILAEEKAEFARKICEELNVDLLRCVAFGDTDQDEHLFSIVGSRVAINANRKLQEICFSKGWRCLKAEDLNDLHKIVGWLNIALNPFNY